MKTRLRIGRPTGRQIRPSTAKLQTAILLILLSLLALTTVNGQTFPAGFNQVPVSSGISNPTVLAFVPDGRIFVGEQGGALRVIKNGALLATPFVSLSVNSSGERGLIGITLDPSFSSNGYVYLYYTVSTAPVHNRISRFTAAGDVAVAGSEVVILELDPLSSATNHNGGAMSFGADGKLYVAIGENANGSNAQNLDTYHGKFLRINPDGSVPAGNPFATGSEQRRRVWSYGLRNPYTFAIHPTTGRIFLNDVGQNTWEEIDDATAGGRNFGWPATEGATTAAGVTSPVFSYPHGTGDGKGCAITGGTFFTPASTNYPAIYAGKYFYQDLCNQWINYIDLSGSTPVRSPFATALPGNAVGLTTGPDGNLYYLSRSAGALYKVVYTPSTSIPVITGQPANVSVPPGQPASFTVTATGTAPLSYQWQKNGVNITGATSATYTIASVAAADAGQYRAVVTNAVGSATSNAATLTVTAPNTAPTAQILTPAAGTTYVAGTTITFSADATDAEDGALPASAFSWRVDFHHDTHVHDGTAFNQGLKTGSFAIPNTGETAANVWYRLYLTVTDAGGLKTTVSRDIYPRTSVLTLATNPAGLRLTLDGQPLTTPATITSVEGILRTLGVVNPQTVNGVTYEFTGWSQGGAATQTLTTPTDDATYTASFRVVPAGQAVTSFTLFNADTDQPIAGYDPLPAGAVLNLATLPSRNLNIRANTNPATVGSVRFGYDANASFRTENVVPYALAGDNGPTDYLPWTPAVGSHTLTATPYTATGATGTAGQALTVSFTVTNAAPLRTPENPTNTVAGLDYGYYEGSGWSVLPTFSALSPVKTGSVTSFDLSPRTRNDDFAFRYTGYVRVPTDGVYTFYTTSDDGSQLFIGNQLVVNNDGLHGAAEKSGTIGLRAGLHALTVTFFERTGAEVLGVSYAGPGLVKQAVPAAALARPGNAVAAVYLSDLAWVAAGSGWGPAERDGSNGEQDPGDGKTLSLGGVSYAKGLGVHASSDIVYALNGAYSRFLSDVGVDDEVGNNGTVNFLVYLDGVLAYTSGPRSGSSATTSLDLDVTGKNELRLVVTNADNDNSYDHADWAGARLVPTGGAQTALRTPVARPNLLPFNLYPNPARSAVTFSLQLPEAGPLRVTVRDALGRQVVDATQAAPAGYSEQSLSLERLAPGLYFVTVRAGSQSSTQRLVVSE
ncbi:PQQ-dependent sugar dehydrogenase [Hymenobacter chitinivorans]|uniref:Putative secreted protein (Por secretion system target) n=1 Tax=Hymenobacter chitinivorans DSM 11115 TaxID=1121954 RepID=A0A2M9B552_9BACT|nr:PQQ-dependent sugar dehydrogenase [Hymenobacter chitinivorans]PJJ53073.1 putative secreted protein (Por secretion system target) [Hymenobacter chitinivorans DSM 11115]